MSTDIHDEKSPGLLTRPQDTSDVCALKENGDIIWWARLSTLDPDISVGDLRRAAAFIVKACNEHDRLTARVEELEQALANLTAAAQQLSGTKFDTYKKRNGHQASIEADDGEKCWIVHSDEIFHLEDASKRARTTLSASDTRDEATP